MFEKNEEKSKKQKWSRARVRVRGNREIKTILERLFWVVLQLFAKFVYWYVRRVNTPCGRSCFGFVNFDEALQDSVKRICVTCFENNRRRMMQTWMQSCIWKEKEETKYISFIPKRDKNRIF